jgi:hypothetical protein
MAAANGGLSLVLRTVTWTHRQAIALLPAAKENTRTNYGLGVFRYSSFAEVSPLFLDVSNHFRNRAPRKTLNK